MNRLKKAVRQGKWNLDQFKRREEEFRRDVEAKIKSRTGCTVEEKWREMKGIVTESASKIVGLRKKAYPKKPWITEEMVKKMEERRNCKSVNTDEGRTKYRKLNNELRRETDKAKEQWWKEECTELEELERKGRTDLMYAKVKQLTNRNEHHDRTAAIKDVHGKLLTEPEEIRNRWKEYIETLYDKQGKPTTLDIKLEDEREIQADDMGPDLMECEITEAIQQMKKNKAVGVDGIPAEFWKALGNKATAEIVELCKSMYKEGKWPSDFTQVVMVPIPKKTKAVECEDHRTISLISHASKIMLKILTKRIEARTKDFIGRNQFGFRKGCGTRDAVGVMRMLCERSLEHGNDIYICFVDFEKAFDRVDWKKMMEILKDLQVDWRDRRMIMELYMNQEAVIRVADGESEPGVIGRGVRQGCPLSPLLFSIYAESLMLEAMSDVDEGVNVGGKLLKDVRFADDQGMVASTQNGLQRLMDRVNETSKRYGMKINVKKTKTMIVSKSGGGVVNVLVDGQKVEQVHQFKYLGSIIEEEGRCLVDVKARIGMAKNAFNNRKELLCRRMSKELKKKIVKTLVWPVALYGCETWMPRDAECKRLDAFEMWVWRRWKK